MRKPPRPHQCSRPSRRIRTLKRLSRNRYRCRKPAPISNQAVRDAIATSGAIAADETFELQFDSGIGGIATPQAQPERRRARIVGEHCETGKTAAEKTSRPQGGSFSAARCPGRCETVSAAETAPTSQSFALAKTRSAAAGAAWTARALATFTRAEGDRRQAGSARHDADAAPPRNFPVPR